MKKVLLICCTVLLSGFLLAQEKQGMVTDRPTQATSASVISLNGFQVESGFSFEKYSVDINNTTYNSTLFRYGIFEKLELRLGLAYVGTKYTMIDMDGSGFMRDSEQRENGFAPITIGAKFALREEGDGLPKLALLTTLSIPKTGADAFEHKNLGADIRIAGDYSLNEAMTFGGNVGVVWSGFEGQDYATGIYAAVIAMNLSEKIGAFAELYGFLPGEGKNDHRWDGGVTYSVNENLQLDFSTGVGLSKVSPDFFISLGLSIRMP